MRNSINNISAQEWIIAACMGGIFYLDLNTPRGMVDWGLYCVPLLLTLRSRHKRLPLLVAAGCAMLIVAGFVLSPPNEFPVRLSIANRMTGIAVLLLVATLIERWRRLEWALERSYTTLRALLRRLERTREEERTRLARDVHDDLGQNLTAVKMDLRWMEHRLVAMTTSPDLDAVKARITSAIGVVDDTTAAVQDLASQLRPSVLDRLGIAPAVQGEVRRFQSRVGISCRLSIPPAFPALVPGVATVVFRILQECLTNIARHAHADRVAVRLVMRGNDVILRVLDNGSGISLQVLDDSKSLGLLGMKERAAALGGEVLFRRGKRYGTLVTVRIPNREE